MYLILYPKSSVIFGTHCVDQIIHEKNFCIVTAPLNTVTNVGFADVSIAAVFLANVSMPNFGPPIMAHYLAEYEITRT